MFDKQSISKQIFVILGLFCYLLTSQGWAQNSAFEAGYQAYVRNQFPVAESYFKKAIATSKAPEDQAFIFKYLGISQFMRGAKKESINSFTQALSLNPKTSVNKEEVLDPNVISFFDQVKAKWQEFQKSKNIKAPSLPSQRKVAADFPPKAKPKARKPTKNTPPTKIAWTDFMPLGIGQFSKNDHLWGSVFLGSQLLALATHFYRIDQFKKERDELNAFLLEPYGAPEEQDRYISELEIRKKAFMDDAQLALAGFGLSWAIGVGHSIFWSKDPTKKEVSWQLSPQKNEAWQLSAELRW